MSANAEAIEEHSGLRRRDRVALGFLFVLLAAGCLVLWIGIPVAALYASSRVTDTLASHFLIALPLTLLAMVLFAMVLFWVNRIYLVVLSRGGPPEEEDELDDDLEGPRWARGPLEPLLVVTLVLAIVALFVWFFAFAENPSSQVL